MGFYYFSVFSWMIFAAYFAITASIIVKICSTYKFSKYCKAGLLTMAFIAPWTEELWIAYNFGQLCQKDAGKFIYKTVEVEGYYDDTGSSGTANIGGMGFKFIEERNSLHRTIERIEKADDASRDRALAWFAKENRGKERPKDASIIYPINEMEHIAVWPNGIDAWRVTKLERPTARYRYSRDINGTPAGHKIIRVEQRVTDAENGNILGRYVSYGRRPYWFFVGLDNYPYSCDGPDGGPSSSRYSLIYRDVLKPL